MLCLVLPKRHALLDEKLSGHLYVSVEYLACRLFPPSWNRLFSDSLRSTFPRVHSSSLVCLRFLWAFLSLSIPRVLKETQNENQDLFFSLFHSHGLRMLPPCTCCISISISILPHISHLSSLVSSIFYVAVKFTHCFQSTLFLVCAFIITHPITGKIFKLGFQLLVLPLSFFIAAWKIIKIYILCNFLIFKVS